MGKVSVIIVDATGNKEQKVGLPDDIKIGIIMVKLVEKIKLPSTGPDGNPISYKFIHKVSGRQLLETQTLADAGIKDGDVLRLQPEITAGAIGRARGAVSRFFKKAAALAIAGVMLISLCGCDMLDYGKAKKLYEKGEYKEAVMIFENLGDYKDSADYLKKARVEWFKEYAEENGDEIGDDKRITKSYKGDKNDTYIVAMGSEGDMIEFVIFVDKDLEFVEFTDFIKIHFKPGASEADFTYDSTMTIDYKNISAESESTTTGVIDIANYTNSTVVEALTYEYEGVDVSGNKSSESGAENAKMTDFNDIYIDNLFNGCKEILAETGMGITLADFGFVSFE